MPAFGNLITGYLGAGKTTAILHLLAQRPAGERWAVLVNDFGAIGIDGATLASADGGIAVREVAGGCVCCAANVPLRVAMTKSAQHHETHVRWHEFGSGRGICRRPYGIYGQGR